VAVQHQVFLQFVQLVVVNHPNGVFLPVHDTGRQGIGQLGPCDGGGLAAQALDHFHIQRNGLNAELEALHIRRGFNLPDVVGEVAEAGFTVGQGAQARLLQAVLGQFVSKGAVQYVPGHRRRWKYIGNVQHVRGLADRRHGAGHDGHMGGAFLNLLDEAVFISQGLGREELHRHIAFPFDDVLENDAGGAFLGTLPFRRVDMPQFDGWCRHGGSCQDDREQYNAEHFNRTVHASLLWFDGLCGTIGCWTLLRHLGLKISC